MWTAAPVRCGAVHAASASSLSCSMPGPVCRSMTRSGGRSTCSRRRGSSPRTRRSSPVRRRSHGVAAVSAEPRAARPGRWSTSAFPAARRFHAPVWMMVLCRGSSSRPRAALSAEASSWCWPRCWVRRRSAVRPRRLRELSTPTRRRARRRRSSSAAAARPPVRAPRLPCRSGLARCWPVAPRRSGARDPSVRMSWWSVAWQPERRRSLASRERLVRSSTGNGACPGRDGCSSSLPRTAPSWRRLRASLRIDSQLRP